MAQGFKRYWGYTAVALSSSFFALVAILTKVAYGLGMTPWMMLTLQSLFASIILLLYALLFRPGDLRVSFSLLPKLLAQAGVGSLGTSFLYLSALLYLPASISSMLLYTYPVLVTLGAFLFFREKIGAAHLLALALAVCGAVLSSQIWQGSVGSLWLKGVFYGLGSAAAYSFFILYGEHILHQVKPFTTLVYVQVFSTIILLLYRLPLYLVEGKLPSLTWQQLLLGFAVGTVASIVPFWLLLEGINYIGASKTSIVSTLELPVTFLLAFVFLGEKFNLWQGIGAVLIVTSVFVVRLRDLRLSDRPQP